MYFGQQQKYILLKSQTWIAAIYGGLMFMPTCVFGGLWGVPYLVQVYDISKPKVVDYR